MFDRQRPLVLVLVGFLFGVAAFVGGFVQFFSNTSGTIVTGIGPHASGSGWFYLVPVLIGLGTLGLFVPRWGALTSVLPLGAVGLALGLKGSIDGILPNIAVFHSATGPGAGLYLVTIGGALLTAVWVVVIVRSVSGLELRNPLRVWEAEVRHMPMIYLGLIGGTAAFAGCFVQFFANRHGTILDASSFWFEFTPVVIGLGTLAFFLLRRSAVGAVLPAGAIGLALGLKAGYDTAIGARPLNDISAGGYLITVLGLVLVIAWLGVLARMVLDAAAPQAVVAEVSEVEVDLLVQRGPAPGTGPGFGTPPTRQAG